ncbi:transposase IS4 family protein [Candidatus Omnitrophus magneticus]|uniref:Transposase IS4 family protein n=2 Tax=Candidatus Omnitrophus magneticus TaxID=1609969 RepID=A0A0F0CU00_9BACT|nr:transposase IS4 family protein [Candidatus Omnitrophus magneticus]KJJ83551.1 transposase IS4 family protein [Candidatus Omnitrophus magneticus]KJJ83718.1 transposase IS4 family protein [Candidatus Omnitrophus magneticus]KJJ83812.1 transposase IS4 family protein [Candidatus Omnitrophus magneticus]KJJ83902.1 transposase IS4 family protein [Candidatus Omnitrophus magneticus]
MITEGNISDIRIAKDKLNIKPDSIYCFDRAYTDLELWSNIDFSKSYFVTKLKNNLKYTVLGQHLEAMKDGILSDEKIKLENKKYEKNLRMIRFLDEKSDEVVSFVTNNFKLSAKTIVQIYKTRWQIEIFFRWIKQNLQIKTFLGTSKNAVMSQVWIAMIYYLLLTYIKYQSKYEKSLFYLHRIIKEALLSRLTLIDLLSATPARISDFKIKEFQLVFW